MNTLLAQLIQKFGYSVLILIILLHLLFPLPLILAAMLLTAANVSGIITQGCRCSYYLNCIFKTALAQL